MSDIKWDRTNKIGFQNILEPVLTGLKESLEHEKRELVHKLENLKRLGVIQMNKEELNKILEGMKFKND
jgi:hypothetical protein